MKFLAIKFTSLFLAFSAQSQSKSLLSSLNYGSPIIMHVSVKPPPKQVQNFTQYVSKFLYNRRKTASEESSEDDDQLKGQLESNPKDSDQVAAKSHELALHHRQPIRVTSATVQSTVTLTATKGWFLLDTETRGVGNDATIAQIAILDLQTGQSLNFYVQCPTEAQVPTCSFSKSSELHWTRVWTLLTKFTAQYDQCRFVAHNASFDKRVLLNTCTHHDIIVPAKWQFYCSLHLLRQRWPGLVTYRLAALVRMCGRKPQKVHNALGDVHSLSFVLMCCARTRMHSDLVKFLNKANGARDLVRL